jgi:hypothetical protein
MLSDDAGKGIPEDGETGRGFLVQTREDILALRLQVFFLLHPSGYTAHVGRADTMLLRNEACNAAIAVSGSPSLEHRHRWHNRPIARSAVCPLLRSLALLVDVSGMSLVESLRRSI